METQTLTKTRPVETTQLPIMKYFDDAKLAEQGKLTIDKWRKSPDAKKFIINDGNYVEINKESILNLNK